MKRKFLLDTHILIWLLTEQAKFKNKNLNFLYEDCFVSVESLKEIALKLSIGKMENIESNPKLLFKQIANLDISILDFDKDAVATLFNLPYNKDNTDPFDRAIIAHAISKKMVLVSEDSQFRFYQSSGLFLQRLK